MSEVFKFGGTSMDVLEQIVYVVQNRLKQDPYVCVSAFSKTTDYLIEMIDNAKNKKPLPEKDLEYLKFFCLEKITNGLKNKDEIDFLQKKTEQFLKKLLLKLKKSYQNLSKNKDSIRDHDFILGVGELISAFVLAELLTLKLKEIGYQGLLINTAEVITAEYENFDEDFVNDLKNNFKKLLKNKKANEIAVIPGFLGYIPHGILHAINRGYTDYTGALVASMIKAKKYIIFKEVDGVCSTDPRIVKNEGVLLKELSYTEVLKMASGGMKAVNTEAVRPAMSDNIPLEVRNTFYPKKTGTIIVAKRKMHLKRKIQNITIQRNVCIIRFGGLKMTPENLELKLLNLLQEKKIKKFFSTSDIAGTTMILSYLPEKINDLIKELKQLGNVIFEKNCAIIAIVGEEMKGKVGILSKATTAISKAGASIHAVVQGASEVGIDFVIDEKYTEDVVKNLHFEFFQNV